MTCDNLQTIEKNIAQAAVQSGRTTQSVQLVAVSKRKDIEVIKQAVSCGQRVFGENYLQEAELKITTLKNKNLCWHFIGHLQSNKARLAAELFDVIETVDRIKIARALDRHATAQNKELRIFVQVNIGREKQKHGVLPEDAENLLKLINQETQLKILGLMGMPPHTSDPGASRSYFRDIKKLSNQLAQKKVFADNNDVQLSMGMSADYTIAIEEGATLVRVGTALFGRRE
ncbi:MAG: YggS family pyridoxal phosphate-dependent enzyme [Desulfobulbaceae bacterium]|nr:YggS family pyridoxal phosphate-dependent enzyme [Desulfobulbaceae bacterium]